MDNKTLRGVYKKIHDIIQWHTVDHYPSIMSQETAQQLCDSLARIASFNDHAGVVFVYELLQKSYALPAELQRDHTFSELNLRYLKSKLKMSSYEEVCSLFDQAIKLNPEHQAIYREYIKYQWRFDPENACSMLLSTYSSLREVHKDTAAYYLEALELEGRSAEILPEFLLANDGLQTDKDFTFLFANAAKTVRDKLSWLNAYYRDAGMGELQLKDANAPFTMDNLVAAGSGYEVVSEGPLVSIIMTAYNSARYVKTAIQSILNQTYKNLELYVCDDVSTDETRAIIAEFAQQDARVVPLFRSENGGTYIAKSEAMRRCNGGLVLFHDSDDWSHPNKIALEVENMLKNPDVMCFNTSWVRINQHGRFFLHFANRFGHPNPAATIMRRRPILENIGVFDPVRTGADTEFKRRVQNVFGAASLRNDPRVMALGRLHEDSLTRSGSAAMSEAGWSPVRALYSSSWLDRLVTGRKNDQFWAPLSIRKHSIKVPYDLADLEVYDARERFGLRNQSSDFVFIIEKELQSRYFTQVHRILMNLNKLGYRCGVYFSDLEWANSTWQARHLFSLSYIQKFDSFPKKGAKFAVQVEQCGAELKLSITELGEEYKVVERPTVALRENGFILSPNFEPVLDSLLSISKSQILLLSKRDDLSMYSIDGTVFKVAITTLPKAKANTAVLISQDLSEDEKLEAQMLCAFLGRSLVYMPDDQEEDVCSNVVAGVPSSGAALTLPILTLTGSASGMLSTLMTETHELTAKGFEGCDFLNCLLGAVSQGYTKWTVAPVSGSFCVDVRLELPSAT